MLLNWQPWHEMKISYLIVWPIKVVWDICHGCWCKWSSTKFVDESAPRWSVSFFWALLQKHLSIYVGLNSWTHPKGGFLTGFLQPPPNFCLGWWHFMIACSSSSKARNGAVGIVTRISGWMTLTPWRRRDCDVVPLPLEVAVFDGEKITGFKCKFEVKNFCPTLLLYDFFSWLGACGKLFICEY